MCKEDIRLARAAKANRPYSAADALGDTRIFGANAERFSLFVGATSLAPATDTGSGLLYARINGVRFPLVSITAEHNGGHVSLSDVGSVICEEIWFLSAGTAAFANLYVGETQFLQSQEAI